MPPTPPRFLPETVAIELFSQPKHRLPGHRCEDIAGHVGNTFWVLDGASTPMRWQFPGQQLDGAWISQQVDRAFRQALTRRPTMPLADMLTEADAIVGERIRAAHPRVPTDVLLAGLPHTTVVLARLYADMVQFALLQDSTLLIRPHPGEAIYALKDARQDRFNDEYYARIEQALRAGDAYGPRYNALLDDMVNRERKWRNRDEGFATFTGRGEAAANAHIGTVPVGDQAALVLATDGAARYWELLKRPLAEAFELPLSVLGRLVREAEAQDPTGARYPRIGVQDDLTLLRVTRHVSM